MTTLKEAMVEAGKKHYWGILLVQRECLKKCLQEMFERFNELKVLEVGAYKCMLVGWLEENFPRDKYKWDYVGIDIIDLPDRRKDVKFYVMSATHMEFPANTFHVVLYIETLEHIVDYVQALRETYRVLVPNGMVWIQSVICYDKCAIHDETHYHVLHPVTLKRLLEFIGFRDVKYVEGGNFAIWGYK